MSKRRTPSAAFKANSAIEAINGCLPIQDIAARHAIALRNAAQLSLRPIQVNQWKRQLLDGATT